MKRLIRIIIWLVAFVFLLLLGGLVAIQSPAVQTRLTQWATVRIEKKIPAQFDISLLTIRPFDAVVLEDVLLIDPHPYIPGMDTVAYIHNLKAKFSLRGLLSNDGIQVKRISLDGGQFNLGYEPNPHDTSDAIMNLIRVLGLPTDKTKDEPKGWGNLLRGRSVDIDNFTFHMVNPMRMEERAKERPVPEEVIDFNNLTVFVEHLLATHVQVVDSHIKGSLEQLRAREVSTGFTLAQLSARKVDVGEEQVQVEGLQLQSGETDLYLDRLAMEGAVNEYSDFFNRIWLDVQVRPGSVLSMPSLRYFSEGIRNISFKGNIQGQVSGYLDDFKIEDLRVEDPRNGVQVRVKGRISGLPDTEKMLLNLQLGRLDFRLDRLGSFVHAWSEDTRLDLSRMARGETFHFNGSVKGLLDHLKINGDIQSQLGSALADISMSHMISRRKALTLGGHLETRDLDLGRLLNSPSLGPLTLQSGLEASFPRGGDMQVRIDSLHISRLQALNYDYSGISAVGTYGEKAFDGRIIAADPNLNFLFQGKFNLSKSTRNAVYRFYASLGYADLHALHLDRRERSKISFQASSNFLRTENHDLLGDIDITGITLESALGRHEIGDLSVKAHANEQVSRIRLDSPFLEGSFVGDANPTDLINDIQYLVLERDLPALLSQKVRPWNGAAYDVSLTIKSAQELLSFLVPGLYVEKNTTLGLHIDKEGILQAQVHSGRLALYEKFIKQLNFNFDNRNQAQSATLTGAQISLPGAQLLNNQLSLYADDNQVGVGLTFDNGEEETRAQVYLSGELGRDEDGLSILARALPSNIYHRGKGWGLSSGDILFRNGSLSVDRLQATYDDEILLIDGGISPTKADTLSVQMEKFDLSLVNSVGGKLPSLEGHATGFASVISPTKPSMGLLASIDCDSTYIAGQRMGELWLGSLWNEEEERFDASVRNELDGQCNLAADAFLKPSTGEMHVSALLNKLNLGYAAPLLSSIFNEFGGFLSGEIGLDGQKGEVHLSSNGLQLEDGMGTLDFTRATYKMNGLLGLDDEGLHFKQVELTDLYGGKGSIHGRILLGGFKNLAMDTHIQLKDMRVLDLPRGVNDLLYGQATGTGVVDISGPMNKILLDVKANTTRDGEVHIGLGGSSRKSSRMLTFTSAQDQEEDPYEAMLKAQAQEKSQSNDLTARLRIQASPLMQMYIDIDDGSTLNARGSGVIELESRQAQGSFTLNGDYNISEGNFLFTAMNLVSRKFTIQDGSVIRFNGDVMNTDLDVHGLYTTKASLANLISDNQATTRRLVNCGINISGRLSNPEVNFSIDIPDLNPSVQAQVDGALNTVDKVQKQFVYLLLAGNFLPAEESGITTSGSDALLSNVSSIMSGQLNHIFEKLDIPLDMGLNYQTTQTGSDIFDVALSTQLFNNRVIVNGTVGNKKTLSGTSTNEVVGDIDIEIKMNRSGSLRVKLFSHSADQYSAYLDNSQRHGAGISYQQDFNSFLQLLRIMFSRHDAREQQSMQEALDATHNVTLDVDQEGKMTRR